CYAAFFGFLMGLSMMIGNTGGLPLSSYFLYRRLGMVTFVATGVSVIMILYYSLIPLQLFVWGNLSWAGIVLNFMALPFILLCGYLGNRVIKVLPDKAFNNLIMALVVLSSIFMLIS